MALFGKTNKHDVKLAKIELEKQKMAEKQNKKLSKEQKKLAMIEQAKHVSEFTVQNFDSFKDVVTSLVSETNELVSKINSFGDEKLSHKEKSELRSYRNTAEENLNYLYLAKEFFVLVNKVNNNLTLNDNQYIYINKFHPFFDGIKVLDIEDDEDDSVLGMFKEIGREFVGSFGSSSNIFSFEDYLENYEDKIKKYIIPDFEQIFSSFTKVNNNNNAFVAKEVVKQEDTSSTEIKCTNCGSPINPNSKFCPECGSKVELPKKKFCSECGVQLQPGAKFCPECGTKAN